MQSDTIEKLILILAEMQGVNALYTKVAIGMLVVMFVMMLVSLYLAYKVHEDTTYLRSKLDSGD